MQLKELNSLDIKDLERIFLDLNEKKFRAKQLFEYFHNKKNFDLGLTVFSDQLKDKLKKIGYINKMELEKVYQSQIDGTKKFLFRLMDNNFIETVFMPYGDRNTLCISTQVGCKMGCLFCASTKTGFTRNLSVAEILGQVYMVENILDLKIDNIVYMGIGEPLDNYDNTLKSIRILNHPLGKNISQRSITVSTSGLADKIRDLADEGLQINLAISLHYPFDQQRDEFMPVNRIFNIGQLMDACQYYFDKTHRRISFEYVLVEKLNDGRDHVDKLVELFHGKNIHINLIPLNEIREFDHRPSQESRIYDFERELKKRGLNATVRQKKGQDIDGACGQLRVAYDAGEVK